MFHLAGDSLRFIVSGCSNLANIEYLHIHKNQVAKKIHQQLALQYGLVELEVPYYRYNPTSIHENSGALLYWDHSIITDRYTVFNRPDIVLEREWCTVIVAITIPYDDNLVKAKKRNT